MSATQGSDQNNGIASTATAPIRNLVDAVQEAAADYAPPGEDRPLRHYLATMATYAGTVVTIATVGKLRGHQLPERLPWGDVALVTVATHKLARLIAKESVTSPLRAPFTRYQGVSGPAELAEEVKGTGKAKAIGELLTCPFCLAVWCATGFTAGMVLAPRQTRLAATVMTAVAGSDTLQLLYAKAEQAVH
ncbi:MAG: DUF1360 domain-containing protein [Actinomycetota bacterium]|nr:DUF1360 domain-containing protein [Actinomycetota bacterium]